MHHIKPSFAKIDPAHLMDGLFVPTNGKKRGRLYVAPRRFGDTRISFQGFEQLGAEDQSVLLAVMAQLGIDGLTISNNPGGPISLFLRQELEMKGSDTDANLRTKKTTLRSILIDAGYDPYRGTSDITASLNRLGNAQIREQKDKGWDRRCNLLSTSFNKETDELHVAVNPRLAGSVFGGQHVKISLYERNTLKTEAAKILHSWLCSNIRLGKALGNGNGAHIDTLVPHVWGIGTESESRQVQSKRRCILRDALDEIRDSSKVLHDGYGWSIDQTSSGLAIVSRPKELPWLEKAADGLTPGQLDDAMKEPGADWI